MIASFVTLLLVPVLYSIFVLDLKLIRWETVAPAESEAARAALRPGKTALQETMKSRMLGD